MITPALVVSAGDAHGIGIEVFLKALRHLMNFSLMNSSSAARYAVMPTVPSITLACHPRTLERYAAMLGMTVCADGTSWTFEGRQYGLLACSTEASIPTDVLAELSGKEPQGQNRLIQNPQARSYNVYDDTAGAMALEALELAADAVLKGTADAVITMPVSKYSLQRVGFSFSGQTEFFAHRTGASFPLMILATERTTLSVGKALRVGLATIHVPLRSVAELLTQERILERLYALHKALRVDFACPQPRIAVLGLNPHAGEEGILGTEERDVIIPALGLAHQQGIQAEGPFPADGFFAHGAYRGYDAVLAMYHDQGLIPLKVIAQGAGVNITAGLPIIRTSPDHGTALDIAGRGIADESSAVEAIAMAVQIACHRASHNAHPA
jgi:4-hydroxythreonine-4-phosphate dehydrogenase